MLIWLFEFLRNHLKFFDLLTQTLNAVGVERWPKVCRQTQQYFIFYVDIYMKMRYSTIFHKATVILSYKPLYVIQWHFLSGDLWCWVAAPETKLIRFRQALIPYKVLDIKKQNKSRLSSQGCSIFLERSYWGECQFLHTYRNNLLGTYFQFWILKSP